ncbi:MAG: InlB B-repeat-containing protein, partial [Rubripirellula sp.]
SAGDNGVSTLSFWAEDTSRSQNTLEIYSRTRSEGPPRLDLSLTDIKVTLARGDTEAPSQPANLSATNSGDGTVSLAWDASEDNIGVADYVVYVNGSMGSTVSASTAEITGLNTGSDNEFFVVARDPSGNISNQSDTVTVAATFVEDERDPDGDGLTNYQELVVFRTDPNRSDSDDDGYDDGQEVEEGSDPVSSDSFPTRTLTVLDVVNGSVSGEGVYALGSQATITAIPDLGHLFVSWSGSASGAQSSVIITMNSDASVGAVFERDGADPDGDGLSNYQELVATNTNPQDSDSDNDGYLDGVEVGEGTNPNSDQSLPTRILTIVNPENGRATGSGTYQLGSTAILSATPDLGYLFGAWTGDVTSSENPVTITMSDNQSVGVRFDQDSRDPDQDGLSNYEELLLYETDPNDPDSDDDGFNDGLELTEGTDPNELTSFPTRNLLVLNTENGSVTGGGTFNLGAEATLTATPSAGYLFASWSGDASSTDNPLTLTMDGNKSIGATFTEDTRDPDADGLSNYEELVVLNTDPNDPDSDNDGYNDGDEVTDGTDPNDSDSYPDPNPIPLRIEKLQGQGLVIIAYWTGELGKSYRVEYSADFQNWIVIDSGIVSQGIEQSRVLPAPSGLVKIVEE